MKKVRSELKTVENILVIDIAEEGKAVGKTDDMVLFIDKAIPGDIVDVEIYRKKKQKTFGD